jgi:hypothetical protein
MAGYSIIFLYYKQQDRIDTMMSHIRTFEQLPEKIYIGNDGDIEPVVRNNPVPVEILNFPHSMNLPYMFNTIFGKIKTKYTLTCGLDTRYSSNMARVSIELMEKNGLMCMPKGMVGGEPTEKDG